MPKNTLKFITLFHKSVRNLQIAIKKLNDSTYKGNIKDYGMEWMYINEWRSYLTKAD